MGLEVPPPKELQDAFDNVGIPHTLRGAERLAVIRELARGKIYEQMVCLPPTHPSRFQQERKLGKVKTISSRVCKMSYSVGKRTLKIVTWGRPISLISSAPSPLPMIPLQSFQQQLSSPVFKATQTSWETPG